MDIEKSRKGLDLIINIFREFRLTQSPQKEGVYYCLEFQSKPFIKDGESQRYFIRGYSDNKLTVYNCLIKIHEKFNINSDFIKDINIDTFEEYVFNINSYSIEGKFNSIIRK